MPSRELTDGRHHDAGADPTQVEVALASFIDKFEPDCAAFINACRAEL